jgi:hypothetical protein
MPGAFLFGFLLVVGPAVLLLLIRMLARPAEPRKDSVPVGKAQPIDGVWEVVDVNPPLRVVVGRGRAYLEATEVLAHKQIEAIEEPSATSLPKRYRSLVLVSDGWVHSFLPATLEVVSENKLIMEMAFCRHTWHRVTHAASVASAPDGGSESKTCPYCAETIELGALACRSCGREVTDPGSKAPGVEFSSTQAAQGGTADPAR